LKNFAVGNCVVRHCGLDPQSSLLPKIADQARNDEMGNTHTPEKFSQHNPADFSVN